jgi:hypothetical protein
MYKRITHTIVEEHFDNPPNSKTSWHYPQRYYDDGSVIPYKLPQSYVLASGESSCANCLAYNPETSMCVRWDALVRPTYICDEYVSKP